MEWGRRLLQKKMIGEPTAEKTSEGARQWQLRGQGGAGAVKSLQGHQEMWRPDANEGKPCDRPAVTSRNNATNNNRMIQMHP